MTMRTFTVYRPEVPEDTHTPDQRNAPDAPQFEGVVFSDGTCVLRWLTACRSTSVFATLDKMLQIHGHPEYGTIIKWHKEQT